MDARHKVEAGYDRIAEQYLGYDRIAEQYLMSKNFDDPMTLAALEELAHGIPHGATALDLGCGAGVPVTHWLAILPADWLSDLERTHMPAGVEPFDRRAIAGALVTTFEMVGRHFQALGEQAGGGFEPEWYGRLHRQMKTELSTF